MAAMRWGVILFGLVLGAAGAAAQEPGVAVMGQVLGPGGAPVGKARVELRPVRPEAGLHEVHATSDPEGLFDLRAPRVGLWQMVVSAEGLVPQQRLLPLLADTHLPPEELVLSPKGSGATGAAALPQPLARPASGVWTGRIIDRETRAPLPHALVWPECDPGRWVWTDAGGAFRFDAMAPCDAGLAAALWTTSLAACPSRTVCPDILWCSPWLPPPHCRGWWLMRAAGRSQTSG